jgi:hypothetical protein
MALSKHIFGFNDSAHHRNLLNAGRAIPVFGRFVSDAFEMTDSSNIITEDRFARTRRHLATNAGHSSGLPTIAANHFLSELSAVHRCAEDRFRQSHPGVLQTAADAAPAAVSTHPWRNFVAREQAATGASLRALGERWARMDGI